MAIGAHKFAGYYAYNAAQDALRAGVQFAAAALKTSAQFAVAGGLVYGGWKAAGAISRYYTPYERCLDPDFKEKRVERLQAILPPLTVVASTLPLAALVVTKFYL